MLPEGITQPRAELIAANINAHTGEVVRRSLGKFHRNALKLTDSQIVIHWISHKELRLKQWVRSRVVEILRFTKTSSWRYIHSSDMIADIGTRRGAKVADALLGSVWIEGYCWMSEEMSNFPVKTCAETKLSNSEMSNLKEELLVIRFVSQCKNKMREIKDYIKTVRSNNKIFILLSDEELQNASNYFYRRATLEVKEFNKYEVYKNDTFQKNDSLYFK